MNAASFRTEILISDVKAFYRNRNISATDMIQWNTSASLWNNSNEDYVSLPSSIIDSPFHNYDTSADNQLVLKSPINLSGAISAQLTFYAKWNTEKDYDYVQVLVSTDNGGIWTALCGKYTVTGSNSEAPGEPVYHGIQNNWVSEEMSLNDYIG